MLNWAKAFSFFSVRSLTEQNYFYCYKKTKCQWGGDVISVLPEHRLSQQAYITYSRADKLCIVIPSKFTYMVDMHDKRPWQNCVFLHIFVFSEIWNIKLLYFAPDFSTCLFVASNTQIIFNFIHCITADFVFVVPWKVKGFLLHPKPSTPSKQHAIPFWWGFPFEASEESSRDCEESQGECGLLREAGNIWQQEEWKGKQHICINKSLFFVFGVQQLCVLWSSYLKKKKKFKWDHLLETLHPCMLRR